MASLDAARQQVQQQQRHHYDDDESFVVRGMRLAADARRLLKQLPSLRVLDGASLQGPSYLCTRGVPNQVTFSSACRARWIRAYLCRADTPGSTQESRVVALETRRGQSIHNISRRSSHRSKTNRKASGEVGCRAIPTSCFHARATVAIGMLHYWLPS
jgi:hypothetical protein